MANTCGTCGNELVEIVDEYTDGEFCPECESESDSMYWEDDGQPDEYTEWQDYMGGDDWDHGQYDEF